MTQEQVNQIITEAMGLCWHEWIGTYSYRPRQCPKCKIFETYKGSDNPDFSLWEHYGPLLEKIQGAEWWEKVAFDGNGRYEFRVNTLLNPTTGSLAIAEFVVGNPKLFGEVK